MWESTMTLIDGNGAVLSRAMAVGPTWAEAQSNAYDNFVAAPYNAQRLAGPRDGDNFRIETVFRP